MDEEQELVRLPAFARWHRIPSTWLKKEALAGRIPHLRTGGSIMLHPASVLAVLADRASKGLNREPDEEESRSE